jgi:uncharacterized membrane protein YkvA (DUF1232 family)
MYGYFGQYPPNKLMRIIYFLPNFIRLFWGLFRDPRVPIYKKALPVFGFILALSYILFPFDMLPDYIAFLGQLDDLTVFLILMAPSAWLFIRICPKNIVLEHAHRISGNPPTNH